MKLDGRISSALAVTGFALVTAFAAQLAYSQDRRGPPPGHEHGPPAEALRACANLARGAACTVDTPRGEHLAGVCVSPPDRPLACLPALPPNGRHGPPHDGPGPDREQKREEVRAQR